MFINASFISGLIGSIIMHPNSGDSQSYEKSYELNNKVDFSEIYDAVLNTNPSNLDFISTSHYSIG